MARDYANITTAIWDDARFCALPAGAQRTYLLLVTQPDITGAGTLALTERRWARCAADTTRESIGHDLKVLESAEFVYVDEDTEEVLVRTFVKHDKGYNNPKRIPVILSSAKAVRSSKLRTVLWRELARFGLADDLPPLPETLMDSLSDRHNRVASADGAQSKITVAEPLFIETDGRKYSQENSLSDSHTDRHTAENRVVVTVGTTDTSTHNQQSTTKKAPLSPDRDRAKPRRRLPSDFAVTEAMIAWARQHTPLVGALETERFCDHWHGNGVTKADWEATWRNWMRKAQIDAERITSRSPMRPALVEHNGLLLKPETAADLNRRKRFEAMDINQQLAIGEAP